MTAIVIQTGEGLLTTEYVNVTPGTGVAKTREDVKLVHVETLTLTDVAVSLTAEDDFGSAEICAFPNRNLVIVGVVASLTFAVAGLTSDVATAVDFALGTVATASADFSNANEKSVMAKVDGVGAGDTGTAAGKTGSAELNVFIGAGAANKLHLNVSSPVAENTGTVTCSGTIKLAILDLGL